MMDPRQRAHEELAELGIDLHSDPRMTITRLRDDEELATNLARIDVIHYLEQWFEPVGSAWQRSGSFIGRSADGPLATEWTFEGRHVNESFNGIRATGQYVTVRGVTIAEPDPHPTVGTPGVRVKRYVDWAGLFAQLGLTLNWRVPLPTEPEPESEA
jgi:hypothetical protein